MAQRYKLFSENTQDSSIFNKYIHLNFLIPTFLTGIFNTLHLNGKALWLNPLR